MQARSGGLTSHTHQSLKFCSQFALSVPAKWAGLDVGMSGTEWLVSPTAPCLVSTANHSRRARLGQASQSSCHGLEPEEHLAGLCPDDLGLELRK